MKDESLNRSPEAKGRADHRSAEPLVIQTGAVERLYGQAGASRWDLSRKEFMAGLERSAKKGLSSGALSPEKIEEYLGALHLEDLALACACLENCEAAWEYFVSAYRGYLRAAAGAILRRAADSGEACELADSLFGELYGLVDGKRGERSLFRYFHGRSTLKTWLRAVLAQRHIDGIRAGRRFEELDTEEKSGPQEKIQTGPLTLPADPHRDRYVSLFRRALETALQKLPSQDNERLRLYYAEGKTLAESGRILGEHESSVSRNLDRIRRELRGAVEEILRRGCAATNGFAAESGLSEAEITLCFEYVSADSPIDLDKLFPQPGVQAPASGRRES
jgi:RNA polymerase sigma factor (sigma-70 family)